MSICQHNEKYWKDIQLSRHSAINYNQILSQYALLMLIKSVYIKIYCDLNLISSIIGFDHV